MNFSFFIAKRYLASKKSQNAINIISGISVVVISIVTMALMVILSGFNGISDLVKTLYNSFGADLRITINEGKTFSFDTSMIASIKNIKGVKYYTEVLEENALLRNGDQQCQVMVRGVSKDFVNMSRFDTIVRTGQFSLDEKGQKQIVLGSGVASSLNAGPNDIFNPIIIYGPTRGIPTSPTGEDAFNDMSVYVSGIFEINEDFDDKYAIVSIENARKLFDYTNETSAVELGIDKGADIEEVREELTSIIGDNYTIKDQNEQNEILFKTMNSEKLWLFIILVFILIIATFNVIGSLTMLIIEKKKDIRTLWYMGADVVQIRRIFLFEGLMIVLSGAFSGLFIGTVICLGQIHFQWIRFNDNFVVSAYPVKIIFGDCIMILGVVLLIGIFAAWYPVKIFTNRNLVLE